jgi:hypothetical protein
LHDSHCVLTFMCSVWMLASYFGNSLIETKDNLSYNVTAFGIVGVVASSYILLVINSSNDLPSIKLFNTGVAKDQEL